MGTIFDWECKDTYNFGFCNRIVVKILLLMSEFHPKPLDLISFCCRSGMMYEKLSYICCH